MTTNRSTIPMPPIVDADAWRAALEEQSKLEDALQEQIKAVAAARRHLPMTPLLGDYTFVGAEGACKLVDLFAGQRQLVIYHFMFAPDWKKGCPHCTQYAIDQGHGINEEISARDTRYVLTSRAPYEKLAAWAEEKGISTPWYSAPTAFSEEMDVINDSFGDFPGISVFFRDDANNVYRTYKGSNAAVESTMPTSGMLRMVPYGLQELGEVSPEGFPQRFEPLG